MKICAKCGAYNADERFFCVDCDTRLGDALPEAQSAAAQSEIQATTEKLYNRQDTLCPQLLDKIIGFTALAGAGLLPILTLICWIQQKNTAAWWAGTLVLALVAVEALLPRLSWALVKLQLSLTIDHAADATPSITHRWLLRIGECILLIFGLVVLIPMLVEVFRPPVNRYMNELEAIATEQNLSYTETVEQNPDLWAKIVDGGEYTVTVCLEQLDTYGQPTRKDSLMMAAVCEITGFEAHALDSYFPNEFIRQYRLWEREQERLEREQYWQEQEELAEHYATATDWGN